MKALVERLGWKFSTIEGDIVLGDGVKMYATKHYNAKFAPETVKESLLQAASELAPWPYLKVIRRKVELVIFDDRSSKVDACNGACPECHLDDIMPTTPWCAPVLSVKEDPLHDRTLVILRDEDRVCSVAVEGVGNPITVQHLNSLIGIWHKELRKC